MKFRIVLPAIFLLFLVLFLAVNIASVGHGSSTFDFVIQAGYPAAFLTDLLERSSLGGPGWFWFWPGAVAGAMQWFLIGYIVDVLLRRRRRLKTSGN